LAPGCYIALRMGELDEALPETKVKVELRSEEEEEVVRARCASALSFKYRLRTWHPLAPTRLANDANEA
jgi:hypothetical protein